MFKCGCGSACEDRALVVGAITSCLRKTENCDVRVNWGKLYRKEACVSWDYEKKAIAILGDEN